MRAVKEWLGHGAGQIGRHGRIHQGVAVNEYLLVGASEDGLEDGDLACVLRSTLPEN
jgi:hypothetical protein